MKSKKIFIIAISIITLIAVTVGMTYAAWDTYKQRSNFDVKVGKNVNVEVSTVAYNKGANSNPCGEGTVKDQLLIPKSAMEVPRSNQTKSLVVGTFKITNNGGWDATQLKLIYKLSGIKLNNATINLNDPDNVFNIIVYSANGVTVPDLVPDEATEQTKFAAPSRALPNSNEQPIVVETGALTLNMTYYVFIEFKDLFACNCGNDTHHNSLNQDISKVLNKPVGVELLIEAIPLVA